MGTRMRQSPALVVAVVALIVALAGTAYAVNKVGGGDLKSYVKREKSQSFSGQTKLIGLRCHKGERFISGSVGTPGSTLLSDLRVKGSYFLFKSGKPNKVNGLAVRVERVGGGPETAGVQVICLKH